MLEWEPPAGFTIAWKVDPDAVAATEVEVRFTPEGDGTQVVLEHRHWDRLGAGAAETRGNYDGGWEMVLGRYVDRPARAQTPTSIGSAGGPSRSSDRTSSGRRRGAKVSSASSSSAGVHQRSPNTYSALSCSQLNAGCGVNAGVRTR